MSYLGSPKSLLIDTLNSLDNSFNVSILGIVSPFSQRDTACLVTMTLVANSSWDKPLFLWSSKIMSFVSISCTSLGDMIAEMEMVGKQLRVSLVMNIYALIFYSINFIIHISLSLIFIIIFNFRQRKNIGII